MARLESLVVVKAFFTPAQLTVGAGTAFPRAGGLDAGGDVLRLPVAIAQMISGLETLVEPYWGASAPLITDIALRLPCLNLLVQRGCSVNDSLKTALPARGESAKLVRYFWIGAPRLDDGGHASLLDQMQVICVLKKAGLPFVDHLWLGALLGLRLLDLVVDVSQISPLRNEPCVQRNSVE